MSPISTPASLRAVSTTSGMERRETPGIEKTRRRRRQLETLRLMFWCPRSVHVRSVGWRL
jgi:hypothetical protein